MRDGLGKIAMVLAGVAVAGAGAGAAFVYAGIYNIAASEQHTAPVYWLLDYAMRRSVKSRAAAIEVPELQDAQRIRAGAVHYQTHCLQCHGAPGVAPEPEAIGMTPAPVNLVSTAREWPASEIYWVVRHGIKMSGMPAWNYKLSEKELWDVVAFIKALPALSPAEYAALDKSTSGSAARRTVGARAEAADSAETMSGDVEAGKRALDQYLCATCHRIPGVVGANRHVGPPLNGIATRGYIAGVLSNTPENMVRWIRYPQQVDPLSAMPNLGVSEQDARDIAAYLSTLDE